MYVTDTSKHCLHLGKPHWSCLCAGSLLLTSADELCLWEESGNACDKEVEIADQSRGWQKVWSRDVAVPPTIVTFTMDSTMFATCGEVSH